MFEAMAANFPSFSLLKARRPSLMTRASAGICIEPENPDAMSDAIRRLYDEPKSRETMGRNGQRYVTEHYDRQEIAEKFERLLVGLRSPGTELALGDLQN